MMNLKETWTEEQKKFAKQIIYEWDMIENDRMSEEDFQTVVERLYDFISDKTADVDTVEVLNHYLDEADNNWFSSWDISGDKVVQIIGKIIDNWAKAVDNYVYFLVNENYVENVYDPTFNYDSLVGDSYKSCIEKIIENGDNHGLTKDQLLEVVEYLNKTTWSIKYEIYDASSYGIYDPDTSSICPVGCCFLGNGEEELDISELNNEYMPFDFEKLEYGVGELVTEAYVADNQLSYAYLTINDMISYWYEWDDVLEAAKELGFLK